MKKTLLILGAVAFTFGTMDALAQDKTETTATTAKERPADNIQKEADALKKRIEQYTIKIEANKDNSNVDFKAEQARIAEWQEKWESLTGKTWAEQKKKK